MRYPLRSSVVVVLLASVAPAQEELQRRYESRNGRTLHFENVTSQRITQLPEVSGPHHKGLAVGDYDRDGDPDVAMAIAAGVYGSRVNKLYRNEGGDFVEITGAPVATELAFAEVSRVAEFRDFDGDGWLDLLIVNDSFEFNDPIRLFLNQHPGGVFSHFVEEGTLRGLGYDWSCGAIARDVDGDGDCDVSSANYGSLGQDTLYLNDGTATFAEMTGTHMPSEADFSVDQSVGDVNADGKPDLFVSNEGAPTFIYYNDLRGQADQGPGDYRYGASGNDGVQSLGSAPSHGSIEPADFDGDGLVDLYWANRNAGTEDVILHNVGIDSGGRAQFVEVALPAFPTTVSTNKVSIADLNGDGLLDAVAMTSDRPVILRNVSVGGQLEFLDWTPGGTFVPGPALAGMSVGVLDSDGDGDLDLFLGALTDDHLFERVPGTELRASDLAGDLLPAFQNRPALAVRGRLRGGEQRTFLAGLLGPTGHLAALLRERRLGNVARPGGAPSFYSGDLLLEVLRDGAVAAASDRGGLGVAEALQVQLSSGAWSVRITNRSAVTTNYVLELLARRDGPDNDLCANAFPIFDGQTPFTNIGAQTDGPAHSACLDFGDSQIPADVWFDYVATCTGDLTVSTCGQADYDTKLAVYDGAGCPVSDATLLGCNEDTAGCANYTSIVTVPVVAGQTYKLRVGGWLGAQGSGTLSISCVPQ